MKKGFDCEHCGNTGMCMSLAEKTKIDWPAMLDEDGKCRMYKEKERITRKCCSDCSHFLQTFNLM